jgi:mRNA-degrading endonuclease RelE of RelBE toxin-antitoxin system
MGYRLLFHPDVLDDIAPLSLKARDLILASMEERLSGEPMKYGKRLSRGLKGFWKLRVSAYRIIYRVEGDEVWVLKVGRPQG